MTTMLSGQMSIFGGVFFVSFGNCKTKETKKNGI